MKREEINCLKCNTRKCGECGYFMQYKGEDEQSGDCANLSMNKECNEDKIDPFEDWARDEGATPLQVSKMESACPMFRTTRTRRVRGLLKKFNTEYENERSNSCH